MEDLKLGMHALIRWTTTEAAEELCHLGLPSGVHFGGLHRGLSGWEVLTLEIADKGAVITEKQRVIAPAGPPQGLEHLWPYFGVAPDIFLPFLRADVQPETDTLGHRWVTKLSLDEGAGQERGAASDPARQTVSDLFQ